MTRPLTLEEISKLIKTFGNAAKILKMAEFDAIELHGHEGYLFDQFKTALWNKRIYRYGGDLENRLRFSLEVIKEIRNAVGNDLALIYRYGVKHYIEGGRDVEEGKEIAKRLEAAGVDSLHVDAGSCTVNPQVGMEREYTLIPAEEAKKVLVIGGGPGGLEAARVAALRGHQVTLWEKSGELGGNLVPASVPEFKKDVRNLINYFTTQIHKLKVDVMLGKEATLETIIKKNPDVAIVATGSTSLIPDILGVERMLLPRSSYLWVGTRWATG